MRWLRPHRCGTFDDAPADLMFGAVADYPVRENAKRCAERPSCRLLIVILTFAIRSALSDQLPIIRVFKSGESDFIRSIKRIEHCAYYRGFLPHGPFHAGGRVRRTATFARGADGCDSCDGIIERRSLCVVRPCGRVARRSAAKSAECGRGTTARRSVALSCPAKPAARPAAQPRADGRASDGAALTLITFNTRFAMEHAADAVRCDPLRRSAPNWSCRTGATATGSPPTRIFRRRCPTGCTSSMSFTSQ